MIQQIASEIQQCIEAGQIAALILIGIALTTLMAAVARMAYTLIGEGMWLMRRKAGRAIWTVHYHCAELGSDVTVSTDTRRVACPACGTGNDRWRYGTGSPMRYIVKRMTNKLPDINQGTVPGGPYALRAR
jgi:hypothetical protein